MQFYFHVAAIRWGIDEHGHQIVTHVQGSYDLNAESLIEKPRAVIERLIFNDKRVVLKQKHDGWQRGDELKSFCANGICSLRTDYQTNLDDVFPTDFPTYN
ncbi:MAG: hypothetical protein ACRC5Q_05415 [Culicoidibacterales bacterium]